jgi:hypothetical protein
MSLFLKVVDSVTGLVDYLKTSSGNLPVTLGTNLDKSVDTIDVAKMSKGAYLSAVALGMSAKTANATSNEIDARGYNAILISIAISVAAKLWTTKLQGSFVSTGTYFDLYEMANTGTMTLMSYQTNASRMFLFKGIPDYVKIVATEDEDTSTMSIEAQLLNV